MCWQVHLPDRVSSCIEQVTMRPPMTSIIAHHDTCSPDKSDLGVSYCTTKSITTPRSVLIRTRIRSSSIVPCPSGCMKSSRHGIPPPSPSPPTLRQEVDPLRGGEALFDQALGLGQLVGGSL